MLTAVLALALSGATAASAAPVPSAPVPDDRVAVLSAMSAELARSTERLRLQGYEAPYFVAYQVKDLSRHELAGRYGAIFEDTTRRDRNLYVDLRVGSYELDSSGGDETSLLLGSEGPSWYAPKDAPLDGDVAALRTALWLATDERYKEALAAYFKKKSRDVYRSADAERAPSFSRETAARHVEAPRPFPFERERWKGILRDTTAIFRAHPDVFDSSMKVVAEKQVRWFASSEGAGIVTEQTVYGVHLQAVARAPDGQLLENGRDFYARTEADLPGPEKIRDAAEKVIAELEALRSAPAIDPYTGPAILEPEATGVLFHEAVGHRLEGERLEDDKDGQTYRGQVGQLVLPSFLTIVDDPTLPAVQGTSLNGTYAFDEQGVAARRTVLVKDGRLEAYLLSRKPVKPFDRSNGHGRSQGARPPMARMANLVVESSRQVSATELKKMLMAEARRQGKHGVVRVPGLQGDAAPRVPRQREDGGGAARARRGARRHAARERQQGDGHLRRRPRLQRLLRGGERIRPGVDRRPLDARRGARAAARRPRERAEPDPAVALVGAGGLAGGGRARSCRRGEIAVTLRLPPRFARHTLRAVGHV